MNKLIETLHAEKCSCVIANGTDIRIFRQRGVADLYYLLTHEPQFMRGACIVDKVIGKAAASLLIKGGIGQVYADTISTPALSLLKEHAVPVTYGTETHHIENRTKTGWCPLEQLCYNEQSIDRMFDAISQFIEKMQNEHKK